MGSGVGDVLHQHGRRVLTCLAGRGPGSRERALQAGFEVVPDLEVLVRECDVVLSIVPPAVAGAVADQVAAAMRATGADLLYADCNAVAPGTVVAIARTMLHNPPILILDEPTSGLDVPTARTIESAIIDAKKAGKCIVYSTHVMEEAEYLCDRIAVIHDGHLKMTGTMDELRAATGKQRLREIFLDLLGLPADK